MRLHREDVDLIGSRAFLKPRTGVPKGDLGMKPLTITLSVRGHPRADLYEQWRRSPDRRSPKSS